MQKCKDLDKLHGSYSALLHSFKNHNIESAEQAIKNIGLYEEGFWDRVKDYLAKAEPELESMKEMYLSNCDYAQKLYEIICSRNLPCEISENVLFIGPIEIVVNVSEYHLMLIIGRKKQKISDLEIGKVSKHIETTFRKLNSSFNANAFFKRLLRAYEYANTRMYACRDAKYGYAVSIKDVFDIFTISPTSADYKIENFLWDLGRLIAGEQSFGSYRLELGFSRDVRKMYLIKSSGGETLKVSTITIFTEN